MRKTNEYGDLWCLYCKEKIREKDPYVTDKNQSVYHPACWEQMHLFNNAFGDIEDEEI